MRPNSIREIDELLPADGLSTESWLSMSLLLTSDLAGTAAEFTETFLTIFSR